MTSPIGRIGLRLDACERLVALDFLGERGRSRPPLSLAGRRVVTALHGYFADPGCVADIPIALAGSPYQLRVWAALRKIPSGSAWTYGDLARRLDSAPRAIGQACRRNPIPILIPCHRILARDGAGGYSGATAGPELSIKRWLLAHEGVPLPA
ncbi:MAG: methylated-DNA--[protein]-cysteine S-methyltransferase [Gammaproteobacteria bacterium]